MTAKLITGGTGFIGAELVRNLLAMGETRPVVFDRSLRLTRLGGVADQVELVSGDLGDFSQVMNVVKDARPSVIFHLGSILTKSAEDDPPAAIRTNALGTFHVLEAARLFDVPQVIFSSSIATYGLDAQERRVSDHTIQRPYLFYGATKLFGEHMGLFYKRKYGLDFRGVRYPTVVGPWARESTPFQYPSRAVIESSKGNPFTMPVKPETKTPIMYLKDAALALVKLAQTPIERIQTVNYLIAGITPTPSARELADALEVEVPGARIGFKSVPEVQDTLNMTSEIFETIDDSNAQREWGWEAQYDLARTVGDILRELKVNPERYR